MPTLYSQCQYFCPAPWRFRSLFVSLILQLLDLWWSDFQNSKFCMIFLGPFQIYKFFLCTTKTPDSTNFEKNIFKFSNFEFWKSNHHKLSNCNVNDTNKDRKTLRCWTGILALTVFCPLFTILILILYLFSPFCYFSPFFFLCLLFFCPSHFAPFFAVYFSLLSLLNSLFFCPTFSLPLFMAYLT